MSEIINSWKYSEDLIVEDDAKARARNSALELGQLPVSPSLGAHIALLTKISGAKNLVEVGTGTGLTGLWMLNGNPEALLTSIDHDAMSHDIARESFQSAGLAPNQCRLITGNAVEVLPRLNDHSYDLAIFDASAGNVIPLFEHALRLTKEDGIVLMYHVFRGGRLAQPTARDENTKALRELIAKLKDQKALTWSLTPVGTGLLQISK